MEPSLDDLLGKLATALDESMAARARVEDMFMARLNAAEQDTAALRDELHTSVVALSNRIEAQHGR